MATISNSNKNATEAIGEQEPVATTTEAVPTVQPLDDRADPVPALSTEPLPAVELPKVFGLAGTTGELSIDGDCVSIDTGEATLVLLWPDGFAALDGEAVAYLDLFDGSGPTRYADGDRVSIGTGPPAPTEPLLRPVPDGCDGGTTQPLRSEGPLARCAHRARM